MFARDVRPRCSTCRSRFEPQDRYCTQCGKPRVRLLLGRFEVTGALGRGATSVVYLAQDRRSCRTVALKVIGSPEPVNVARATDGSEASRTWATPCREVAMHASVRHEGAVRLHEWLSVAGGLLLVMEHVEGATLRQLLDREGRLRPPQAVAVLDGAMQALAHLHARGIVHGDVKPENILVSARGNSKLADFGQAVACGQPSRGGSPGYLSPEAQLGQPLDQRSDVYALGAVLHECLTGSPPRPWRPPLRGSWRGVLRRALAEDPRQRQASAAILLAEVRSAAGSASCREGCRLLPRPLLRLHRLPWRGTWWLAPKLLPYLGERVSSGG